MSAQESSNPLFSQLVADACEGADLSPGNPASAWAVAEIERLRAAGLALYMAGRWTLPRSEMHQDAMAKLWENLRDALGLAPGTATAAGMGAADETIRESVSTGNIREGVSGETKGE